MNGKVYTIFQYKPGRVMESHNLIDLTAELHLLALGQYFAESFAKWAAINSVDVPSTSIL